ncbi:MAG TPA: type II toxin-antitoxin system VapC family toxin [Candidatus Binataceae bacterium]|nr:type II toxin-antitoxin system VapC family toxin [Candidatus Binataceae bacterium]
MPLPWAYFDTSVLVKRYVREAGSRRARELMRRYRFLSCAIIQVEALSALSRRRTAGDLDARSFGAILSRMRADRAHWELVELGDSVLTRAEGVVRQSGASTLDALHIASALAFQELSGLHLPFITADERQPDAAERVGLDVMWLAPA